MIESLYVLVFGAAQKFNIEHQIRIFRNILFHYASVGHFGWAFHGSLSSNSKLRETFIPAFNYFSLPQNKWKWIFSIGTIKLLSIWFQGALVINCSYITLPTCLSGSLLCYLQVKFGAVIYSLGFLFQFDRSGDSYQSNIKNIFHFFYIQ